MQKFLLCISTLLFLSCNTIHKEQEAPAPTDYFGKLDGCFLLYNVKTQHFDKVIGEARCRQRFPACSTFKVPLAVMAFDSGVLKNENVVLKWDGVKDSREVANKDHDAKSWMKDSIVWFSQRLTPKIGELKLKNYLNGFAYGNEDLSGGLTQAWLNAPDSPKAALKISAYEQVEFMKKLWSDKLPANARSQKLARELTYLETSQRGYRLNGKTGSNFYTKNPKLRLGWFVAHVDNGINEYIAVTNFSDKTEPTETGFGGLKAREITKRILDDSGIW